MNFLSFFMMIRMLGLLILKWWVLAALDLNLQYRLSSSTFYCNVMTFLCFLGALLASLGALCTGPMVLFKVYNAALNKMKNTREPQEIIFCCDKQFIGGMSAQAKMISVTCILSGYLQHLSSLGHQQEVATKL